ncbi:MAG: adenylate/guanylate cyclase domain-containing protein [Defluviitaleaceae bacterium]|nr:adenylate/guanylate cyclase domain-containing protein [Defluviitaleaceae bacterium]
MKTVKRIVTVFVTILLIVLFYFNPFLLFEYRLQDVLHQTPRIINNDIVIIGMDEWSMAEIGTFPWSRQVWADALNILNSVEDAQPAVIAIDVLFATNSLDLSADWALVDAVAASDNIILASLLETGLDFDGVTLGHVVTNHVTPFYELAPHATNALVDGMNDADGFVRNALLRIPVPLGNGEEQIVYSFPLATAMKYTGLPSHELINWQTDGGYEYTFITYSGLPGDFFEFSFSDIFEDWFDPIELADRIVLIGPWAVGMMDSHAVPIAPDTLMYGVEIHANVLQMILEGNFRQRVSEDIMLYIAIGLIVAIMLASELFKIRTSLIVSFAITVLYFAVLIVLQNFDWLLPVLTPAIAIALAVLYNFSYSYIIDSVEKSKMRDTFKKYVDAKLVDQLIDSKEIDANEVGRRKDIAIVFVDVRGFTSLTESMRDNPEIIVESLNSYLELTSSAILNNGGSVDKFVGDATMGLFNGFVPLDDYVFKAVKSAWDMATGSTSLNAIIKERNGLDLGFGIGVHCGEAIVGNLGPSFRKDYTAIGDSVNTAARLEGQAQRSQIIISADVYERVKDRVTADYIGEVALKGKTETVNIYSVTNVVDATSGAVARAKTRDVAVAGV